MFTKSHRLVAGVTRQKIVLNKCYLFSCARKRPVGVSIFHTFVYILFSTNLHANVWEIKRATTSSHNKISQIRSTRYFCLIPLPFITCSELIFPYKHGKFWAWQVDLPRMQRVAPSFCGSWIIQGLHDLTKVKTGSSNVIMAVKVILTLRRADFAWVTDFQNISHQSHQLQCIVEQDREQAGSGTRMVAKTRQGKS